MNFGVIWFCFFFFSYSFSGCHLWSYCCICKLEKVHVWIVPWMQIGLGEMFSVSVISRRWSGTSLFWWKLFLNLHSLIIVFKHILWMLIYGPWAFGSFFIIFLLIFSFLYVKNLLELYAHSHPLYLFPIIKGDLSCGKFSVTTLEFNSIKTRRFFFKLLLCLFSSKLLFLDMMCTFEDAMVLRSILWHLLLQAWK